MEQVSLWNISVHTTEFKKFKYYFLKAFLSFSKLTWGLISLTLNSFCKILSLLFIGPNLYKEVSPSKKVIVNKTANYFWPRNF